MVGGAPPKEVEMALCDIGTVFLHLTEIKANPDCTAGCAGGTAAGSTAVCPRLRRRRDLRRSAS